MATITLDYDRHNTIAQKSLDLILSLGVFRRKVRNTKPRIETGLDEYSKGKVFFVRTFTVCENSCKCVDKHSSRRICRQGCLRSIVCN